MDPQDGGLTRELSEEPRTTDSTMLLAPRVATFGHLVNLAEPRRSTLGAAAVRRRLHPPFPMLVRRKQGLSYGWALFPNCRKTLVFGRTCHEFSSTCHTAWQLNCCSLQHLATGSNRHLQHCPPAATYLVAFQLPQPLTYCDSCSVGNIKAEQFRHLLFVGSR